MYVSTTACCVLAQQRVVQNCCSATAHCAKLLWRVARCVKVLARRCVAESYVSAVLWDSATGHAIMQTATEIVHRVSLIKSLLYGEREKDKERGQDEGLIEREIEREREIHNVCSCLF